MDQNDDAMYVVNNNGVTDAQLETGQLDGSGELDICNLLSKRLKDMPILYLELITSKSIDSSAENR